VLTGGGERREQPEIDGVAVTTVGHGGRRLGPAAAQLVQGGGVRERAAPGAAHL
jgi:hypothetical protein